MKTKLIMIAVVLMLAGCTSAGVSKSLSSGVIGCKSDDIKITDEQASIRGTHEWTAECGGKTYVCSYVNGSNTNCAEAKVAKVKP